METMAGMHRSCGCGRVTEKDCGKELTLAGWVNTRRDHGGLIFIDLRDRSGIVQVVMSPQYGEDAFHKAEDVRSEYVLAIRGIVRERSPETVNPKMQTGKIEVVVSEMRVLNKAKTPPFYVEDGIDVDETVRLKHRYIDLRRPEMQRNLIMRHKIVHEMRQFLDAHDFLEVETPILTKSTPEGARDYLVPSRVNPGKFYALPQAPQIFKQLLMVSGFDKYFQVAPCFRDEDARKDRVYGEFYQLDMEMCFAEQEDIYALGEEIFTDVFKKFSDKEVSTKPFVRIPYKESMLKYGTDKPDLRNPLIIIDLTSEFSETTFKPFKNTTVRGIKVDGIADKSNSWFNELVDFASSLGMPGIGYITVNEDMTFKGPIDKFLSDKERENLIKVADLKKGSVLFFIADKYNAAQLAGAIRDELGRKLNLLDENKFEFCIINDFPMFEYSEEEGKMIFTHNPFSMPQGGMDSLLNKKPEDVLAYQFDFVCNGVELVSGAVRNHDINIMKKAFEIAGYTESDLKERFKSLYTAFQYGAPPHAGMAIGIDRMLMMLKDEDSIREVIAFPMSASGQDMMMGSPSEVTEQQLREVHIKVR